MMKAIGILNLIIEEKLFTLIVVIAIESYVKTKQNIFSFCYPNFSCFKNNSIDNIGINAQNCFHRKVK
jgi:hypothetical protein